MEIAVIGMGRMGRAVAKRALERGHDVTVWNRTPGRAPDVLERGGREAPSAPEAAGGAEAVLVSLADDGAVRSVLTGDGGIFAALGEATVIDMSTVSPETSRELAREAPGGRYLAVPILGGPDATAAGQAAVLVGGRRDLADALSALLDDLSAQQRFCGEDPGLATALKLLSNYLLMTGIAALAEFVATAERLGFEDGLVRDFLSASPLVAPGLHNRLDDILGGGHEGWFTTTLAGKDVGLAVELARGAGVSLPLASTVEAELRRAAEAGYAEDDIGALVELRRARA